MSEAVSRKRRRQAILQGLEWPVVWISAIVGLGLGLYGFRLYLAGRGVASTGLDHLYLTLRLFLLESGDVEGSIPWQLEVARFALPAVAAYTAGKALALVFRDQLQNLRLLFRRGHAVICGGGRKGRCLVREFHRHGVPVVLIERDRGNPILEICRDTGALVLVGDATETEVLRRARVHRASYLVSVCGDDGVNAEVAVRARDLCGGRTRGALTCIVHIFDPQLWRLLRERSFASGMSFDFRLEFFNTFERGARALLRAHPPFDDTAAGASDAGTEAPHVSVVGAGRLGSSLVAGIGRRWMRSRPGRPITVSVVDRSATERIASLKLLFPGIDAYCELVPLEIEIGSAEFERGCFLIAHERLAPPTAVYVCLDHDARSLSTALAINRMLRGHRAQVVARMEEDAGLASLLASEEADCVSTLHSFGLLDRICTYEMVLSGALESLAKSLHEHYLDGRMTRGVRLEEAESLIAWEELAEELKESNRAQAASVRNVLQANGFGLEPLDSWDARPQTFSEEEVQGIARLEHTRWMSDLTAQGWRCCSGEKSVRERKHPDLVPWRDLPERVREIDREFARHLPAVLVEAGFGIERTRSGEPVAIETTDTRDPEVRAEAES